MQEKQHMTSADRIFLAEAKTAMYVSHWCFREERDKVMDGFLILLIKPLSRAYWRVIVERRQEKDGLYRISAARLHVPMYADAVFFGRISDTSSGFIVQPRGERKTWVITDVILSKESLAAHVEVALCL
jgi:hypothetical protein